MLEQFLDGPRMLRKRPQVVSGRHWCKLGYCTLPASLHIECLLSWHSCDPIQAGRDHARAHTRAHTQSWKNCVHLQHWMTFSSYLVFWCPKHQRRVIVRFSSLLCHFTSTCPPRPSHRTSLFPSCGKGAERSRRPRDHLPPVLWQPHRQRLRRQHAESLVCNHRKGMGLQFTLSK